MYKRNCMHCGHLILDQDNTDSEYCILHRAEYKCQKCNQESLLNLKTKGSKKLCDDCIEDSI